MVKPCILHNIISPIYISQPRCWCCYNNFKLQCVKLWILFCTFFKVHMPFSRTRISINPGNMRTPLQSVFTYTVICTGFMHGRTATLTQHLNMHINIHKVNTRQIMCVYIYILQAMVYMNTYHKS